MSHARIPKGSDGQVLPRACLARQDALRPCCMPKPRTVRQEPAGGKSCSRIEMPELEPQPLTTRPRSDNTYRPRSPGAIRERVFHVIARMPSMNVPAGSVVVSRLVADMGAPHCTFPVSRSTTAMLPNHAPSE